MDKQYTKNAEYYEAKLTKVMTRLGVETYSYDWNQRRGEAECYVEMRYGGRTYRFENSSTKSAETGRGLKLVSDIFASVVLSLEGLARAVEQGIFTLDMLLEGVPALPEASTIEPCFQSLGFSRRPASADEVNAQYHKLAKVLHPDVGGDADAFITLQRNYQECLQLIASGAKTAI